MAPQGAPALLDGAEAQLGEEFADLFGDELEEVDDELGFAGEDSSFMALASLLRMRAALPEERARSGTTSASDRRSS
ncbi:hypothetical protein, partial [Streptomyces albidoflavus]|uniref:hypothetical protein n=1 Tax=Streptomyces albidoflavus TaxID=1886 RepID=UPI0015966E24